MCLQDLVITVIQIYCASVDANKEDFGVFYEVLQREIDSRP